MASRIVLPGLIDPHVHFRDPGQTHKEDFFSGTSAALAGGYTTVLDMPNNIVPVTTSKILSDKIDQATKKIVCDVGFNFGTLGDNFDEFPKIIDKVTGLKIYLNITTGNFIINKDKLSEIYSAWPGTKPILLHAEDDVSDLVLSVLKKDPKPTHICHVSSEAELTFVLRAKAMGLPISCGVTPHHLFLTSNDEKRLGAYGLMKPSLKSKTDLDFIWNHLDGVDVIESDHAPHTRAEKQSQAAPFGVPGVETTLSLMLTAKQEGKISRKQIIEKLHYNPAKIFGIKTDPSTKIFVDLVEYRLKNSSIKSKAGWTPFNGKKVIGRVSRVELRGQAVYEDGKILAKPGSGRIIS